MNSSPAVLALAAVLQSNCKSIVFGVVCQSAFFWQQCDPPTFWQCQLAVSGSLHKLVRLFCQKFASWHARKWVLALPVGRTFANWLARKSGSWHCQLAGILPTGLAERKREEREIKHVKTPKCLIVPERARTCQILPEIPAASWQ